MYSKKLLRADVEATSECTQSARPVTDYTTNTLSLLYLHSRMSQNVYSNHFCEASYVLYAECCAHMCLTRSKRVPTHTHTIASAEKMKKLSLTFSTRCRLRTIQVRTLCTSEVRNKYTNAEKCWSQRFIFSQYIRARHRVHMPEMGTAWIRDVSEYPLGADEFYVEFIIPESLVITFIFSLTLKSPPRNRYIVPLQVNRQKSWTMHMRSDVVANTL